MRRRFLNSLIVITALLLWYLLPLAVSIGVGWWIGGAWGWLVAASGFAWPIGNVALGSVMGCD